ncbi:hypothetical protein EHQ68_07670 [Leptospira congkakensis]|uniref:Lipoprotein n=1 Tax=Leptospira congkakensis TaxID=2484932 RepID=A0A4Z1A837_9LEPT|nr:hypothetical protein [Leptospira congkakensis]TGL87519.1 hypothetical protein EHQ69_15490 [Leptospira congkakensis]TGL89866.1 hypothetical protein EHQ68_07670 [Leptospira congkakensis]TGL95669.1 hypothetical protein EHQ70_11160 [Leptospira congkakensis]
MNDRSKVFCFLYLTIVISILSCAAFPDPITSKERKSQTIGKEKVKVVFTGFYRYDLEKKEILETLLKRGLMVDPNSNSELELILQKREPVYKYIWIHRLNLLVTFLSGGLIPSHIRTEQTITFRYSKLGTIERESVYEIGMNQWRGIPVIIIMVLQWPNRIFKEQLIEATELEVKDI